MHGRHYAYVGARGVPWYGDSPRRKLYGKQAWASEAASASRGGKV
jgi:hypothetical protein